MKHIPYQVASIGGHRSSLCCPFTLAFISLFEIVNDKETRCRTIERVAYERSSDRVYCHSGCEWWPGIVLSCAHTSKAKVRSQGDAGQPSRETRNFSNGVAQILAGTRVVIKDDTGCLGRDSMGPVKSSCRQLRCMSNAKLKKNCTKPICAKKNAKQNNG